MIAASHFARAAALLTPLTSSFRTLYASPLESPDSERTRTHLIVREALLQCSALCICLLLMRTHFIPFRTFTLHAYPSNTPSHSPQRTHQSLRTLRGLRAVHTSKLFLSTTPKRPCFLPPPLRLRTPPRPVFGAQVRLRQPAEQNELSRSGYGDQDRRRPDSPGANHTLVSQGWTAMEYPAHARALARHCQRLVEGAVPSHHSRDTKWMRPFVNPSL
jgi:hypothetical protein